MNWIEIAVTFAVVVIASRLDALRDRHFDPERRTRWRQTIVVLGTDPWHVVKWGAFYPPLILCCWMAYGPPASISPSQIHWTALGLWIATTAAAWIIWRWGSPWGSFWTRIFKRFPLAS